VKRLTQLVKTRKSDFQFQL